MYIYTVDNAGSFWGSLSLVRFLFVYRKKSTSDIFAASYFKPLVARGRGIPPLRTKRARMGHPAEKLDLGCSAPKGASDFKRIAVSLKRYPDTKLSFQRSAKPY